MSLRAIYSMARADFLERVRRYSFLITVLFAVYLGYAAATGKIALRLGDYRGLYNSAWIGVNMAMVGACFITLAGFYVVKNAIERDRATRVGEILAATPLTRSVYLVGKWLSNAAVLAAQVAVLALASIGMQFVVAEDPRLDVWALLSPFLLLALPAVMVTGAVALLFETLPVLRGGVGNVVWFFAWATGIALAAVTGFAWLDFTGLFATMQSITRAARAAIPNYNGEFALQAAATRATIVATGLRWPGIHWDLTQVLLRLEWVGVSLGLVLLAAPFFDRFDPARGRNQPVGPNGVRPKRERRSPLRGASEPPRDDNAAQAGAPCLQPACGDALVHLSSLGSARSWGFYRMFTAELRLALKGCHWWWSALAGGLVVAQCASPLEISRGPLLTAAWIWPLLLWSAMGVREARHGTEQLIFSTPRVLRRQLPAGWLVGVLIAAVTGGGVAARVLLARNYAGLLGWSTGVLFIPTLALALGVWTGSSRPFEGLYTGLWYIGPLNHVPGLDFTGGANGANTAKDASLYLALTAALFACAFIGRRRQLRRG